MTTLGQSAHILRLLLAHERGNFQFQLFNAFIYPATIAYLGFMLVGDDPELFRVWMAGSVCMGLGMGGFAQVGFSVIVDRFQGRLDLLRCQPVSKGAYLAAHLGTVMVLSGVLVVVAVLIFGAMGLSEADGGMLVGAVVGGSAAGASIGGVAAVLAFRAKDFDSGNTVIAMAALGMAMASPVFYEVSALPALLGWISWLSPFTGIGELLRSLLRDGALPLGVLAWTVGSAIGWCTLSYRMVRWQS